MTTTSDPALLWVDIETTGLDPHSGRILELGLRITDSQLNTLSEASWVVYFPRPELSNLSDFILELHTKNGLLFEAMKADRTEQEVEHAAESWVFTHMPLAAEKPPMAGSTVSFDRRWLEEHMPRVNAVAHYRSLDVSSIKLAARIWSPDLKHFEDRETHRSMPDIEDSIAELRYYIKHGIVRAW